VDLLAEVHEVTKKAGPRIVRAPLLAKAPRIRRCAKAWRFERKGKR
jgi:hypothetical protein